MHICMKMLLASTILGIMGCEDVVKEDNGSITTPPDGMKLISSKNTPFKMGDISGIGDENERPVHQVTISYDFYIDSTEVTQSKYKLLMGVNPSTIVGDNYPVESVNWYDAALYCNVLSKNLGKDTVYSFLDILGTPGAGCTLQGLSVDISANGFRLPTEAEWEYAYRAGTTTDYFCEESELRDYARFSPYNGGGIDNVASKKPNPWGLYDMAGNVREWCNGWYTEYSENDKVDPTGPSLGEYRVVRNSGYMGPAVDVRAAWRWRFEPSAKYRDLGFRVVLPIQ